MKISDENLHLLLDDNILDFTYNTSITSSILEKVSMYIDEESHSVDAGINREGVFEVEIWVGEEKVNLTEVQFNNLHDKFQVFFASQEAENASDYFTKEREADLIDYAKYYY